MNPRTIEPIHHPLSATVRVPGSKSLTNRALAVAALADGVTSLINPLFSDDTHYFSDALTRLGLSVQVTHAPQPGAKPASAQARAIHESSQRITVIGLGGRIPARRAELFVGNAGTAARFLTAFVTLGDGEYLIDGNTRMRERPIADLVAALNALGAAVHCETGCPPVRVAASGLPGGRARVAGDTSSQFLSALLLAAPYARTTVEIVVERGLNSKPYVDLTLAVMSDFGVDVERQGYERFRVAPARYRPRAEYAIESDASAASYFFAAPAILGGSVRVQNISRRSRQADVAFLDVLTAMGCRVAGGEDWIEVSGPAGDLRGVEIDLRDMSDTAQTLAAIAPFASTPTLMRGIGSARVKETDRVSAMCTELARLGVSVTELPDGLVIQPCREVRPAIVETYGDHRMAMAFALVGLRAPGVQIADPACVSKTFPDYYEALEALR